MNPNLIPPDGGQSLSILGMPHQILLTGKDTDGAFAFVKIVVEPGQGVPPHIHANEEELFHVLAGSIAFTVAGETATYGAGATALLPRDIPHGFTAVGETPATILVTAMPAGLEAMFAELGALPPGPPDFEKIVAICGRYGVTILPPPTE